eukprot:2198477-Amphidinium_carterae.1
MTVPVSFAKLDGSMAPDILDDEFAGAEGQEDNDSEAKVLPSAQRTCGGSCLLQYLVVVEGLL